MFKYHVYPLLKHIFQLSGGFCLPEKNIYIIYMSKSNMPSGDVQVKPLAVCALLESAICIDLHSLMNTIIQFLKDVVSMCEMIHFCLK